MGQIRRLVLDILKPYEPGIVDLAQKLSDISGVIAVNINIYEMDRKVENAKITIEGDQIPLDEVTSLIQHEGGAVHSIDEVVAGSKIIDATSTLQD
jgi:hypothetical protein